MKIKIPVLVAFLLVSLPSYANKLGVISEIEGKVTLHSEGSPRGKKVNQVPSDILSTQFVRTYAQSKAKIKLTDDSKIIMTENSTLEFTDNQNLAVENGKILFSINKRDATRSLNILTETAVIGVKGTIFLIEANAENALLHLHEGEVEVSSLAEEFEQFKSEYERFKREYKAEFDAFKKQLTIKSGTTLSLSQQGLKEIATPDRIKALFDELDSF